MLDHDHGRGPLFHGEHPVRHVPAEEIRLFNVDSPEGDQQLVGHFQAGFRCFVQVYPDHGAEQISEPDECRSLVAQFRDPADDHRYGSRFVHLHEHGLGAQRMHLRTERLHEHHGQLHGLARVENVLRMEGQRTQEASAAPLGQALQDKVRLNIRTVRQGDDLETRPS